MLIATAARPVREPDTHTAAMPSTMPRRSRSPLPRRRQASGEHDAPIVQNAATAPSLFGIAERAGARSM